MLTTHGHWFAPTQPGELIPQVVTCPYSSIVACPDCTREVIDFSIKPVPGLSAAGFVEFASAPPVPAVASSTGVLEVPVDELKDWYQRYLEAKDAESRIKDVVQEARSMFLDSLARRYAELPDKVNMTIGGKPVLQRQVIVQNRVDTTRLRREQPGLADAYSKQVRQERLNIL